MTTPTNEEGTNEEPLLYLGFDFAGAEMRVTTPEGTRTLGTFSQRFDAEPAYQDSIDALRAAVMNITDRTPMYRHGVDSAAQEVQRRIDAEVRHMAHQLFRDPTPQRARGVDAAEKGAQMFVCSFQFLDHHSTKAATGDPFFQMPHVRLFFDLVQARVGHDVSDLPAFVDMVWANRHNALNLASMAMLKTLHDASVKFAYEIETQRDIQRMAYMMRFTLHLTQKSGAVVEAPPPLKIDVPEPKRRMRLRRSSA